GRLGRNRLKAIGLSILVTIGLWFFFIFLNTNPALSWELIFGAASQAPGAGSSISYFISMTIAALAFGCLTYLFCRIYSRDIGKPEPEVDKFFTLLKTPIDVEKEVGDERETATVYPFVGIIVMLLAVMTLALLLFPAGRANPVINIVLAIILVLIGLGIMQGGRNVLQSINKFSADLEEK
ncbi:MAG: hypothetical protein K8R79_02970, partial [Calditrichales bacterium]|nr:hypothetical protein [Calditrichales bacterium]